ncbi:capsular polysaccharide biosynthesis protein [Grimontia indica]|uniref:Capsular polysaccharide biosynthesis protein n=1 Tax=Grimontia indica TaxID=1056512 RepID=R1GV94_9GAMM|nr:MULTISPECIES: oligosaccharide flippase family protein [Grimontia]EOD80113.1 capsular polysaccharide biosynthesis protein [Grimontia indica]
MKYFRTGILLVVLSNMSNLLNYGLMVYISRALTKNDFAVFSSVTALGISITSFLSVFPSLYVLVYNDINVSKSRRSELVKSLDSWALLISSAFFVSICMLSFPATTWLNISSPLPMLFYSVCLFNSLLLQILVGYCQGQGRFELLQVQVFLLTITKLVATYLMFTLFNVNVYYVFFAEFIASGVSLLFLKNWIGYSFILKPLIFNEVSHYFKKSIPVGITLFISGVLLSSDIVFSKYLFSSEVAGDYSVASNLGKIAFFVSGAISGIVFAITKGEMSKGNDTRKVLWLAILASLLCGGVVVLLSYLFPNEIILTLFGERYLSSASLFQVLSISMTLLSINTVCFNYFLAGGNYRYIQYSVFVLAIYSAFIIFGNVDSPQTLAYTVLGVMFLLLSMNIVQIARLRS